ncbi:hypothetical protein B2J88_02850 [Rhodococcus sp. SRB_17]|uniref:hypothetical protein n=1 Tax=Rhodococcus sp. OK302 TaxID=1882769 RepID=UPI000B942658|nr:hypothetical protein [Rhodococcus sp. OK302]NMM83304.1 hypothetical protein [Rhodococcus sp. SRB_17]OYD70704.1 hypothetical protein BDB13_4336 [Rhodococcus sp. OK302]
MLIIGILLFGTVIGAGAQLILGSSSRRLDWPAAFAAGISGSLLGGLLVSLIAGDGLSLRPSGIVGSLAGAVILTAGWQWYRKSVSDAAASTDS